MFMICRLFAIIALASTLLSSASAQARYEVASIHPSRPGSGPRDVRMTFGGDSFDAEAATVGDILDMLNGWQLYRVVGGPAWMTTDRYNIHAKAAGPVPVKEQHEALMALLADRFNLSVHSETRDAKEMVLLAPKKFGGVKPAAGGEAYSAPYNGGNPLIFTAVPMNAFTNYLGNMWHSPVIDQTGLEGPFDFTLNLSTDAGESYGDRIRDAVLATGFRVEDRKVPTEFTVVDHCERPGEN